MNSHDVAHRGSISRAPLRVRQDDDASSDAKPTAALRVDRGHPARVTYADAHDCSACPKFSESTEDATQRSESTNPNTRGESCRWRVRRSHSPWDFGVVISVPSARDSQLIRPDSWRRCG